MIIRGDLLEQQTMEKPRGGEGTAIRMAYEAACGFKGEVTNFAMMQLDAGSSIGYHAHEGDMEIYLILDGVAKTSDNGEEEILNPGDMLVTKDGESHNLVNDTLEPVTFLALIIKH
ncbi:MAG: cupin domain-containing protein [Denitrovibrio sp.]|mgnify:CR=1 FL=1|nr:MAG: cupin domain-containing protein [Denitrovibrio sp.]